MLRWHLLQSPPAKSFFNFQRKQGHILHDARERHVASLHDKMDMIRHETEAMDAAAEFLDGVLENQEEALRSSQ